MKECIFFPKTNQLTIFPVLRGEVFDVSGAGDTVISALTLAYLYDRNIETAALIANHSAAVAVAKKGTASVSIEEIWIVLMLQNKIIPYSEIAELSQKLHQQGKKIVFTNGCFDILHCGHILYLEKAKALGDILILGLNSDAPVKRLKGNNRPIVSEKERALVVAGLESVDYVCIFEQDTPYELIDLIQPDVLVKGGDWTIDKIVGTDIVQKKGGKVLSLNYEQGFSTTNIIERIKQDK